MKYAACVPSCSTPTAVHARFTGHVVMLTTTSVVFDAEPANAAARADAYPRAAGGIRGAGGTIHEGGAGIGSFENSSPGSMFVAVTPAFTVTRSDLWLVHDTSS